MQYDFTEFESQIAEITDRFTSALKKVRTGRATPSILDGIQASSYGVMAPLVQMASVGVEDARTLKVTPFDPSALKDIEKAITDANLGLGIIADDAGLRLTFPELTGERRQELVKMAKKELEAAKVALRQVRDETWKDIQRQESEGQMSQDEKFANKELMEEKFRKASEELESVFKSKEQDILGN